MLKKGNNGMRITRNKDQQKGTSPHHSPTHFENTTGSQHAHARTLVLWLQIHRNSRLYGAILLLGNCAELKRLK